MPFRLTALDQMRAPLHGKVVGGHPGAAREGDAVVVDHVAVVVLRPATRDQTCS